MKPIVRKREYFDSLVCQSVHEIECFINDITFFGKSTKAQRGRAYVALGVLNSVANYCKFGNYDKLEKLDHPDYRDKLSI